MVSVETARELSLSFEATGRKDAFRPLRLPGERENILYPFRRKKRYEPEAYAP